MASRCYATSAGAGDSTPVLVLTARDGVTDRVTGLREGADDYMAKPFAMEELVARLQALLRRPGNLLGKRLTFGNVALDNRGTPGDRRRSGQGVPRARDRGARDPAQAQRATWRPSGCSRITCSGSRATSARTPSRVYVHRLRKMLADAGATVKIHTVRGVGYLMAEEKGG